MNRLPHLLKFLVLCLAAAACKYAVADISEHASKLSTKKIVQFAPQNWKTGRDTRVTADLKPAENGMGVHIPYSGKGFEYYRMEPIKPIGIPGEVKTVTIRLFMSDPGAGMKLAYEDGHGQWKEIDIPRFPAESWEDVTLKIPAETVFPISLRGFLFHNYGTRTKKTDVLVAMDNISATTDLANVDSQTGEYLLWKPAAKPKDGYKEVPQTPLFEANFGSSAIGHFFAGTEPELILTLRNWYPQTATVKAHVTVIDESGNQLFEETKQTEVVSSTELRWRPTIDSYGPYRAQLHLDRTNGEPMDLDLRFALAPKPRKLSPEEKLMSPYGMNYHAGHGLFLTPFREAGIVWFRDYAFTWSWLKRAKGKNHNFTGWPGYPGIIDTYNGVGALVMPVLVRSIPKTAIVNGEVTGATPPDREWTAHLADVLSGFPHLTHWELDNEYALKPEVKHAEDKIKWAHYQKYHQTFGDGIAYLGHGELKAVENGRHGVRPDLVEDAIDNGSFANIDVINFHHYCGVEAPELNVRNYNTGGGGRKAGLFGDKVRDLVKVANKDGKEREVFITEFGWDTLAGYIVSEDEQAAYLARAYMMLASCGVDRAFWYWHFDSPTPSLFFDGCGLMTDRREPKPSLCAMAGLTHILPDLDYVGEFNFGPNTQGYVFQQNGKYIASAWNLKVSDEAQRVDFGSGAKLQDLYGNAIQGSSAELNIAPIYAKGIAADSPIMLQTAYAIDSHHYQSVTAGEPASTVLKVCNNRAKPISASIELKLPDSWTAEAGNPVQVNIPTGSEKKFTLKFQPPESEPTGVRPIEIVIKEDGEVIKTLRMQANVLEPYYLEVGSLQATEKTTRISATVTNLGSVTHNPIVSLKLPETWKAISQPVQIQNLEPEAQETVSLDLVWSENIPEGQSANVVVSSPGVSIQAPIPPPVIAIHQVPGKGWFGGQSSQWPKSNHLPNWILGSTHGQADADVWLGWTPDGLWCALEVNDCKVRVTDPTYFWRMDALELFIDTQNDKNADSYGKGDHQFWLVPQPDSNEVYLGQWKRGEEIDETRQDIPLKHSSSSLTENGYRMEFVIPWEEIQGAKPTTDTVWGLNFNLNVKGLNGDREVFWPSVKSDQLTRQPRYWGAVKFLR